MGYGLDLLRGVAPLDNGLDRDAAVVERASGILEISRYLGLVIIFTDDARQD